MSKLVTKTKKKLPRRHKNYCSKTWPKIVYMSGAAWFYDDTNFKCNDFEGVGIWASGLIGTGAGPMEALSGPIGTSKTQRSTKTDGFQKWQGFDFLNARRFGIRLFWYPFGCLFRSTQRGKGYQNRWA